MSYRIAVVQWTKHDGIARAIHDELIDLGHQPVYFGCDEAIPEGVDVVFSFAPYGRFLQIPRQLADLPADKRPVFLHWDTEALPNPRIPWNLIRTIGGFRSWIGRLDKRLARRMFRFRCVGDYYHAYRKGWIDVFVESSEIHAQLYRSHGLPAKFVPWGAAPSSYANLDLERDIDVLWMGKRRTKQRSELLDQVRGKLATYGFQVYVADNEENPFIFGEIRTQYLNRAKITLNLLTKWYDNNFAHRFNLAAGNRSLVVSEPILPHFPLCEPGIHYVSAPAETLMETILYYLEHENERLRIVANAYQLVTTELTLGNSIKSIVEAVNEVGSS